MNFLEAQRILTTFQAGEPLRFCFALSGTVEPFGLYLRAAAAQRGRAAEVTTLPFNTLAQALRRDGNVGLPEVFLLLPWDFVPEADWRSGIPESLDDQRLRSQAAETARHLGARPTAHLLYVPAPLPPLFPDSGHGAALGRWLESLAVELGARLLPAEAFSLAGYFASGCPVRGNWIGRVAEAVVEAVTRPRAEPKKVLVTDLDNVLWAGLVGEEGADGVSFEPAGRGYRHFVYQTLLRRLRREGVLLAAVSRNDPDVAVVPFRAGKMPLREDDFVSIIASYHAKSSQIRGLAERLNLGLDSFVFVDDNPVEVAEVSLALPDVRCVPFPEHDDGLPACLNELADLFRRREITAEDRERTALYRRRLEGVAPSDLEGADLTRFLQDLRMTLTIHDRRHGDRTRTLQLINKTNQFNLNGHRITEAEIAAVLDAGGLLFGATLADRTGEHGEILSCLLSPDRTITALVMSCRVFQRRIEYAFLAWLAAQPNTPLAVRWVRTARNEPFLHFLQDVAGAPPNDGLVPLESATIAGRYARDLALFTLCRA